MTAIFGGYDQAGLDAQYNNRDKVPDAGAIAERWMAAGAEARGLMSTNLDVAYGDHPRQAYDVFPAEGRDNPILAFIHGGYWHSQDKDLVHFLAPTYVAAGITFVSIDYRLCPEVTIPDVVDDVTAAVRHISDNASEIGGDPKRLHVAGHSAGGHLTAMLCGSAGIPGTIAGGCSVSGLHDLEPIRLCYLNEQLHLDAETARAMSPIRILETTPETGTEAKLPPLIVTVGGDEGPEYLRQRDELVDGLRAGRQPVLSVDVPGGNHFTALEAFGDPHHELCQTMLRQILAPAL